MYPELYDVLIDVIETPISPELKKGQVTEDNVGKYEINDFILHRFLYAGDSKETTTWLLEKAFNLDNEAASNYVKNFYFRFFTQQFKRSAMPDGPKVFNVSLSKNGFNIPSDLSRR
jgi:NAD+ synthase (glutamine-hydrolysing)